jgi:hypothetical protein
LRSIGPDFQTLNIKHSIQLLLNPNPPDVSPPSSSIAWDPTIIQTLGLDQTTLDVNLKKMMLKDRYRGKCFVGERG